MPSLKQLKGMHFMDGTSVWENMLSLNEGAYTNEHEEIHYCPYF